MDVVSRYFWIAFIVASVVNGRSWWSRIERRIQQHPELLPGYRRLFRGFLFWTNVPWLAMGAGILSGRVGTFFDYLQPAAGNPFVLAWWGLMAGLLLLGTAWIFFGGGAETLERHPGMYMVPEWPAAKLRLYWLGLLAWNVVIGTFLYHNFGARRGPQQPRSSDLGAWLPALFPVAFVGMWLLVSYTLAVIGGWSKLAAHYPESSPCSGARFRFRSGQIGGLANYSGMLTLGADPMGLHLAVALPFRVGHPPLCVPWSDVRAREVRSWLSQPVELEFAKAPNTTLRIAGHLARSLIEASGARVQIQPAA